MKFLPRVLFLVLVCGVFNCPETRSQYLHPKIKDKTVIVRSAVILPPKVELVKESAKGSEMMVAESEEAGVKAVAAVEDALKEKKINVLKSPFENNSEGASDDLKYTLANTQSRYDALLPKLVNKSGDVKKGRFSLGDEVMVLNVDKSADVLIFIRGQGRVFTKGKTAFSLLNPFSFDYPILQITVGFVDARSGEVLAFTKPIGASKAARDPKALAKLIRNSLKKLPPAS